MNNKYDDISVTSDELTLDWNDPNARAAIRVFANRIGVQGHVELEKDLKSKLLTYELDEALKAVKTLENQVCTLASAYLDRADDEEDEAFCSNATRNVLTVSRILENVKEAYGCELQ